MAHLSEFVARTEAEPPCVLRDSAGREWSLPGFWHSVQFATALIDFENRKSIDIFLVTGAPVCECVCGDKLIGVFLLTQQRPLVAP